MANESTRLLQPERSSSKTTELTKANSNWPSRATWAARSAGIGFWWVITTVCALIYSALASKNSNTKSAARFSAVSSGLLNLFDGICFGRESAERFQATIRVRKNVYYLWYISCFLPGLCLILFNAIIGWDLAADSIAEIHKNNTLPELRALNFWAKTPAGQRFGQLANSLMVGAITTVSWQSMAYNLGLEVLWFFKSLTSRDFRALRHFQADLKRMGPALMDELRNQDAEPLSDFIHEFYKQAKIKGLYVPNAKNRLVKAASYFFSAAGSLTALYAFFLSAWVTMMITEEGLKNAGIPATTASVFAGFVTSSVYVFFVTKTLPQLLYSYFKMSYHHWNRMSLLPSGISLKDLVSSKLATILLNLSLAPLAWYSGYDWSFLTLKYGEKLANSTISHEEYPVTLGITQGATPFGFAYRITPLPVAAMLMLSFTMCGNLYGVYGQFIHAFQHRLSKIYPDHPLPEVTQKLNAYCEEKTPLGEDPALVTHAIESGSERDFKHTLFKWCFPQEERQTDVMEMVSIQNQSTSFA